MPFLRLTRDRRGFENTFLMHADRPGDRPRLLYWYRTAPGITLGRLPLDEDAIRAIEEQHPDIDFDWPAILALSEVMTPEDEAPAKPPQKQKRRSEPDRQRPREPRRDNEPGSRGRSSDPTPEMRVEASTEHTDTLDAERPEPGPSLDAEPLHAQPDDVPHVRAHGLVDQLAGREIAARLRARFDEMSGRVRQADESVRQSLVKQIDAMDPDRWDTPEAVLEGVSKADALFEQLRAALHASRD